MSGALASTVVTSKVTTAESMPELVFVAGVHRGIERKCHPVHLVVALAHPQVDMRLVDDLLQLRCGLVDLGLRGRRRRAAAEALRDIGGRGGDAVDVQIARYFVRIDTFDLVAGNRGIVQELGRIADRRENLAGVEIARRDPGRKRRAGRRGERVGGQVVPLAVDLDPRLAAAGADLGLQRRLAQCDADVHVGALAGRIHDAVDAQVDRLLRKERELLVGRRALDVNGHIELQLLWARAGLCIDCAEDAGCAATATRRRRPGAGRGRRVGRLARTATSCDRQREGSERRHCDWGTTHQNLPPHAGCAIGAWYMALCIGVNVPGSVQSILRSPYTTVVRIQARTLSFPGAAQVR